jgi:hypothetical protein
MFYYTDTGSSGRGKVGDDEAAIAAALAELALQEAEAKAAEQVRN